MGISHRSASVFLRTAGSPANHFGHQVLESGGRHTMVSFVHLRIGIQSRIDHDAVDEVVYDGSNAIHATKSVVERGLFCRHGKSPPVWKCIRTTLREVAEISVSVASSGLFCKLRSRLEKRRLHLVAR